MARRKKKPLPQIDHLIEPIKEAFRIRFFTLQQIPEAVAWAERGNIAIHENYHSRRRQSYHVISGDKDNLFRFCHKLGIPLSYITASEFYRFWHLTWYPNREHNLKDVAVIPPSKPDAQLSNDQGLT